MAIGFLRKVGSSISGWEKSHFGGFRKVIYDHPYISLDFKVELEPGKSLQYDLGYSSNMLLKIYLLKLKENHAISSLQCTREETINPFTGKPEAFDVIDLGDKYNKPLLEGIIGKNIELSPLFDHYRDGILESKIRLPVPPEDQDGDGDGKGDGEDEQDQEGKGGGSDGEGEEEKDGKSSPTPSSLMEKLENIKTIEHKPFDSLSNYDTKPKYVSVEKHNTPFNFSASQVRNAEHLVKLLDISFEPKSDIVKSLRLGKLDTSKIAEVPSGNVAIYKQTLDEQDTRPFSVCFLMDMSGSMEGGGDRSGKNQQFEAINSFYLAMKEILPLDKIFIYGHSGYDAPEIYTFHSPLDPNFEYKIQSYKRIPFYNNYDGPVIEQIHKDVRNYTDDSIIFIVISDGQPYGHNYGSKKDYKDMKSIIERARRDNFVTVGIGLNAVHVKELYNYHVIINDMKNLVKDASKLINHVVRTEFK